jgi:regulatory protein
VQLRVQLYQSYNPRVRSRKPPTLDAARLLDYALRTLSGRALSQGELRARLALRAQNPGDVEDVIGKVKEHGYLNDQRFAEAYARLRLENEGYGRSRVLRDLRARRVAPGLADEAVREAYREVDEDRLIDEYLRRKLRHSEGQRIMRDPRKLASLHRSLLRAGFPSGKIWAALRRLSVPEEWVEALESAPEETEASE